MNAVKVAYVEEASATFSATGQRTSFKVSVMTRTVTEWADNGLRFFVVEDANNYARDLQLRWSEVRSCAVFPCTDKPNCVYPVPSDRYPVKREFITQDQTAHPCPKCKEASTDKLVWMPDDTTVACLSCGTQFVPGMRGPNGRGDT